MTYDTLIPVIRRLALEAGDKIMEIYEADDFDVKVKSDSSPVTEADEAADALISAGLRAAFPDILLVTEEQAASHSEKGDTFLIVDPLEAPRNSSTVAATSPSTSRWSKTERQRGVLFMHRLGVECSTRRPMAAQSRKPARLTKGHLVI